MFCAFALSVTCVPGAPLHDEKRMDDPAAEPGHMPTCVGAGVGLGLAVGVGLGLAVGVGLGLAVA
jgi:hypothetical protein